MASATRSRRRSWLKSGSGLRLERSIGATLGIPRSVFNAEAAGVGGRGLDRTGLARINRANLPMSQLLRVLIVEDNSVDAELLLRAMRSAGFDCEWQRVDTEAEYV